MPRAPLAARALVCLVLVVSELFLRPARSRAGGKVAPFDLSLYAAVGGGPSTSAAVLGAPSLSPALLVEISVGLLVCLSLSVCLPACLPFLQSSCLSVTVPVYLSVCLSDCLSVSLSLRLSILLSPCLSACLPVCLSASHNMPQLSGGSCERQLRPTATDRLTDGLAGRDRQVSR